MKNAPHKAGLRLRRKSSKRKYNKSLTTPQVSALCEPLRRLQWLRQELDNWDQAGGDRPMPQPRDLGIPLQDLRPSEVHFGREA